MPSVFEVLLVPVIMGLSTVGTIGLIKLIRKMCPGIDGKKEHFKEP